jgi:hypothetical protein
MIVEARWRRAPVYFGLISAAADIAAHIETFMLSAHA